MGSARKTPNPWNLVLEKFCASKTEEDIKGLEEARDNFLEEHAKEFGLLDYPFGDASSRLYGFHYKETSVRLFYIVPIVTVSDALFHSGTNLPHLK